MSFKKNIVLSACLCAFGSGLLNAQQTLYNGLNPQSRLSLGANLAFGTHIQRLGFTLHFHLIQNHFQANSEIKLYYQFKNLGPKIFHPELVLSQGLVYAWSNNTETVSSFESIVSNQTPYKYALAYAYNAYFNPIRTSQQTGIIGIHIDRWQIISENDLLARPALDRFRTAAVLVQYREEHNYLFGLRCQLWTGQFGHKHNIEDPHFKNHCYMDTVGGRYTNSSHGILALQINTTNYFGQNLQAAAGIDAEQIRQAVQNKFIHDMPFIPAKWQKQKNCHLPMLDTEGKIYLFQASQKIRKPKLFLNASDNGSIFY